MKKDKNTILKNLIQEAQLVIFDMNGLIVDDEPVQLAASNLVFQEYHIKMTKKYWIEKCVGHRTREVFIPFLKAHNIPADKKNLMRLVLLQVGYYKKLMKTRVDKLVRKKILNLIKQLVKTKELAVATSSKIEEVEIILGKNGLNLKNKFKLIICGDQVKKGKPNPEVYLKVAKKLKIKTKDCLVFEDAEAGVIAAKKAGMKVVAVPSKFTKPQNFKMADLIW